MNGMQQLVNDFSLSAAQEADFQQYLSLLLAWNKKTNLTRIVDPIDCIEYHFRDSLSLANCIDITTINSLADVGTGAGFPGLALAIAFEHLQVVLIEVNNKKIAFLEHVIEQLGLQERCTVSSLDWRTFVRKTDYALDLVCARASLQPSELLKMFGGLSPYKDAPCVYWASKQWVPEPSVAPFVVKQCPYRVGNKTRKLVFFKKP